MSRHTISEGTRHHKLMNVQSINHFITYSVITAEPKLDYSSVVSTIKCYPVTSGENEGSTFVEWTGNFSSDAGAGEYNTIHSTTRRCFAQTTSIYAADRPTRVAKTGNCHDTDIFLRHHPRCEVQAS